MQGEVFSISLRCISFLLFVCVCVYLVKTCRGQVVLFCQPVLGIVSLCSSLVIFILANNEVRSDCVV